MNPKITGSSVTSSGAGAIAVNVIGPSDLRYNLMDGASYDIQVAAGVTANIHACDYDTQNALGTINAEQGDRAAWDDLNYASRHAYDISAATFTYHNNPASPPVLGTGTTGRIAQWTAAHAIGDSTLEKTGAGLLTLTAGSPASLAVTGAATISGSNTGDQTITLTGDVTGSGTGTFATTLATVNGNVGTFGSATQVGQFTVNAKGLITAASNVSISFPGGMTGFANPTASVGLTAVNGVLTTAMRSDAAPPVDQGIAPTWTGIHAFNNATDSTSVSTGSIHTAGGLGVTKDVTLGGYVDITAIANPAAPSAGFVRLHALTTQGFSRLEQDNEAPTNLTLGRDNVFIVRNTSGSLIAKGKAVYLTGSTGNVPNIALAKADTATTLPAIGLLLDDIANNAFGQAMALGVIAGIDTSGFGPHVPLYVSATSAGDLTLTRPVSPNLAQRVGSVMVLGVGTGSILVTIAPFVGGVESGTTATTWRAAGVVNAVTGYQINGAANTNTILIGNGTNYVASANTLNLTGNATLSGTNTGDQTLPVGANPTADVVLTATNGSAATFMRSDGAPALSQAIAPTWTGVHTFNPSTTPSEAIVLDIAALVSNGTRESHIIRLTGQAYDGAAHNADWRMYVHMTSNAGGSALRFDTRIGAAAYASKWALADDGSLVLTGGITMVGILTGATSAAFSSTTDSTSVSTGAISTAGGVGISKSLVIPTTSGTTGYGLKFDSGANGLVSSFQALDLGGTTYQFFVTNRYYDGSNWQQLNTRAAGNLTIEANDTLKYYTFPASSSTPTQRMGLDNAGVMTLNTGGLIIGGTTTGAASSTSFTNVTSATTTNAYAVKGGQAAGTANTGWIKIFIGTNAAWIPYWQNATP